MIVISSGALLAIFMMVALLYPEAVFRAAWGWAKAFFWLALCVGAVIVIMMVPERQPVLYHEMQFDDWAAVLLMLMILVALVLGASGSYPRIRDWWRS